MAVNDQAGLPGRVRRILRGWFIGRPQMLAVLPALTLAAYWTGGETAMILAAVLVPGVFALTGALGTTGGAGPAEVPGLLGPETGTTMIDRAVALHPAGTVTTAVIAVGLDVFAAVARELGETGAKGVLAQAADRLRDNLRDGDILTRLDGAEFAIFLPSAGGRGQEAFVELCERLRASFGDAFSVNGQRVYLSISLGLCPPGAAVGRTGADALDAARNALDAARAAGEGSIRVHSREMPRFHVARSPAAEGLGAAIEAGAIEPHLQPQVSAQSGILTGVELLPRWRHSAHGVLTASEFLPHASPGDLGQLAELCLRDALALQRGWAQTGVEVPRIAVNLPVAHAADPEFVERLVWQLDRYDAEAERLSFDLIFDPGSPIPDAAARALRDLSGMGVALFLENFGAAAGPSIPSLQSLGATGLKLGRRQVARLDTDEDQRALAEGLLGLAQSLGLETVAVGVETRGEADRLTHLGCDHLQGYHVARPMPPDRATAWIREPAKRLGPPRETARRAPAAAGKTA